MSFDFFPNEQSATLLNAARRPAGPAETDTFTNFLPGAASYTMRSLAQVGRAVDLAGSVFPIAYDAITGGGTTQQDAYFREHDEVFNGAVDAWTPRPGEVGAAGQIAGQLAGGVLQAVVSPALLVGTSQLSTGEDLVRQGVDAGAANVAGDIAGIGAAAGLAMPFLGNTLASRVLSGAAGNVVQGAATAGATHAVLNAAGNPAQAGEFDASDLRARLLDGLLGAAFGGLAHAGAPRSLAATDEAALLVANQARHLEQTTSPGRPASETDLTQHVQAMRDAIDQVLRGDPVTVDQTVAGMRMRPDPAAAAARAEVGEELRQVASEEAPPAQPVGTIVDETPIRSENGVAVDQLPPDAAEGAQSDLIASRARALMARYPDLTVPTGLFAADGSPESVRIADVMAHNQAETAQAVATAPELFRTAAACLLGVL